MSQNPIVKYRNYVFLAVVLVICVVLYWYSTTPRGEASTFTLAASGVDIIIGGSSSIEVQVNSKGGFHSEVTLTIESTLPSGVTATFDPASVTPPANGRGTSILTLAAASGTSGTSFQVTIRGTSGTTTYDVTVSCRTTSP